MKTSSATSGANSSSVTMGTEASGYWSDGSRLAGAARPWRCTGRPTLPGRRLDDALCAQLGDPPVADPDLAQDPVGVLPQLRRGRADPRRRALEVHAAGQDRQRPEGRVLDGRGDRQRLDLL